VIGRDLFVAVVVAACLPAVVAGVALGIAVAVGCDRLRSVFADPFGYWEESDG
jgi:hypothetical protein